VKHPDEETQKAFAKGSTSIIEECVGFSGGEHFSHLCSAMSKANERR